LRGANKQSEREKTEKVKDLRWDIKGAVRKKSREEFYVQCWADRNISKHRKKGGLIILGIGKN